jgi:hypothetical protein
MELLSRELKVTAALLSDWRDRVERVAETALKDRTCDHCDDKLPACRARLAR